MLGLLAGVGAANAGSSEPATLRIETVLIDAGADSIDAELVIEPVDVDLAASDKRRSRMVEKVPSTLEIAPQTPGPWTVRLVSDSHWAREVTVSSAHTLALLEVFATTRVSFEIATRDSIPIPEAVDVDFSPVPKVSKRTGKELPTASISCPLSGAIADCQIPMGSFDLRIGVAGAAPLYLWDVDLERKRDYDLGKLAFVRGGSVVGFVTGEDGMAIEDVTVELAVSSSLSRDAAIEKRLEQMKAATVTNERGFFQILGVGAGTYALQANKEGFSPSSFEKPLTFRGDLEHKLPEALILKSSTVVEIVLDPALDHLGKAWRVTLFDPSRNPPRPMTGTVSNAGVWSSSEINKGGYLLVVTASDGSRWLGEEIEISQGENLLFREIDLLRVVGTVSMGQQPITGQLTLILKETGAQADFDLDSDGEFEGYLPKEGTWEVRVALEGQERAAIAVDPIEIVQRPGKSVVEVEIEIPETRIEGDVVDAYGAPVSGASIYLLDTELAPYSEAESDDQGSFQLQGLRPGEIVVYARERDRTSALVTVQLQEHLIPPRLRLELQDLIEMTGQVVSSDGLPLPGASLVAWVDRQGAPLGKIHRATTDIDGSFVLRLSPAQWLNLLIRAPGFAARVLREPIDPRRPVVVAVDREGGSLTLDLTSEADRELVPDNVFLSQDGVFINLFSLLRFSGQRLDASDLAKTFELKDMASGTYTLCFGGESGRSAPNANTPASACESGFLAPGGVLTFVRP